MLPADLLSRCAEFCPDAPLCALRGVSAQTRAATQAVKEERTRYSFSVAFRGRAECAIDGERALRRLRRRAVKRFVASARCEPVVSSSGCPPLDRVVAVTFTTARREHLPLLHHAARQFLRSLRTIPDGHVLCQSIKFSDEFDGVRDGDLDGLASRVSEKTVTEEAPRGETKRRHACSSGGA